MKQAECKSDRIEQERKTEKQNRDEGPFLEEERNLLIRMARSIGDSIEREQAREITSRTASYLDMMGDALVILNMNKTIVKANESALKLWGFNDLEDMIGLGYEEIVPQTEIDTLMAKMKELSGTGRKNSIETTIITKEGVNIPVILSCSLTKDANGRPDGYIGVFKDISSRKNQEEKRLILEKELQQALRLEAIGTLAAGIAHEINTPIQFIGNNAEFLTKAVTRIFTMIEDYQEILSNMPEFAGQDLLARKIEKIEKRAKLPYLQREIPEALNQTLDGVDRVARIVKAMKDFSHMGSDVMAQEDINSAVESTIPISRNEWKYVAEMKTELDPSLPLVECFIGDIKQVLLNLIVNAAHTIKDALTSSGETSGQITVRTFAEDGFVFISVSDTGKGIPAKIENRIFEPFFTTKEVGKGTGQGLSITYQTIVEKHGGDLSFETEIDKGTTFIVKLPVVAENAIHMDDLSTQRGNSEAS